MRYDIEEPIAQTFADYLGSVIDNTIAARPPTDGSAPNAPCLIVTFDDPMSIDEADRVIIMVPQGQTKPERIANGMVAVDVATKTRWTQNTLKADFLRHAQIVKQVRGCLWPAVSDLVDRLQPFLPAGIGIDFVHPGRSFRRDTYKEGWLYSELGLTVNYYTKQES